MIVYSPGKNLMTRRSQPLSQPPYHDSLDPYPIVISNVYWLDSITSSISYSMLTLQLTFLGLTREFSWSAKELFTSCENIANIFLLNTGCFHNSSQINSWLTFSEIQIIIRQLVGVVSQGKRYWSENSRDLITTLNWELDQRIVIDYRCNKMTFKNHDCSVPTWVDF